MTPAALLDEILRLSEAERLRLVEEVWDSLAGCESPIPDWIKEELDRRDADPSDDADISWDEVRTSLRSRNG